MHNDDQDIGKDDHLGTAQVDLARAVFSAIDANTSKKQLRKKIDLDDGSRDTRCGDVHLRYEYETRADNVLAKYEEAKNELADNLEKLTVATRDYRVVSSALNQCSGGLNTCLETPELERYRLLIHINQAKDLPAADGNFAADPYLCLDRISTSEYIALLIKPSTLACRIEFVHSHPNHH